MGKLTVEQRGWFIEGSSIDIVILRTIPLRYSELDSLLKKFPLRYGELDSFLKKFTYMLVLHTYSCFLQDVELLFRALNKTLNSGGVRVMPSSPSKDGNFSPGALWTL